MNYHNIKVNVKANAKYDGLLAHIASGAAIPVNVDDLEEFTKEMHQSFGEDFISLDQVEVIGTVSYKDEKNKDAQQTFKALSRIDVMQQMFEFVKENGIDDFNHKIAA